MWVDGSNEEAEEKTNGIVVLLLSYGLLSLNPPPPTCETCILVTITVSVVPAIFRTLSFLFLCLVTARAAHTLVRATPVVLSVKVLVPVLFQGPCLPALHISSLSVPHTSLFMPQAKPCTSSGSPPL